VFVDIGEAVRLVYEEADRFGVFDHAALRRVYGGDYESKGIEAMGQKWLEELEELEKSLEACDTDQVEAHLAELAALNRAFSVASTERYLALLQSRRG
jgi:hypothetical protein